MTSWPTKKLGEILEYEQPTKYLVSSTDYKDEYPIPVLTAGKSFILGNTNENNGVFPKEKLPVIIFDDFTTAIKFVDFPFKVKSSAMKILHAKKNEADIKYLFNKLLTIKFPHNQHKRYWISECSKIEIPFPPLEIQKQIVERLDKIIVAQKLNDELIQKADELYRSLLHNELNVKFKNQNAKLQFKIQKLGECLIQFDRGISWSRSDEGGFVAVLRIPNIEEGNINFDDLKHISTEKVNSKLEENDIVMVASNGNPNLVGRSALVTKNETGMLFASFLVRLRFNDTKLLPQYVHLFLLTSTFKQELRRKIATTSGIYNLRKEHIEKIKILLPPLKTQKQIVEKLSAAQEYKKQLLEQCGKLKELFDSVLHKLMNAQRTPK